MSRAAPPGKGKGPSDGAQTHDKIQYAAVAYRVRIESASRESTMLIAKAGHSIGVAPPWSSSLLP